jgi:hypothetical protein
LRKISPTSVKKYVLMRWSIKKVIRLYFDKFLSSL